MTNKFIRFFLSVLLCGCLHACEEDHSYIDPVDPVISVFQLSGTWRLTQWRDENLSGVERYCYLKIESKENRFELYQNFDSAQPRHITGSFSLKYDEELGHNIIRGVYDHASGYWNNDYVISNFNNRSMTWTVQEDALDVSIYTRCPEIPFDLL